MVKDGKGRLGTVRNGKDFFMDGTVTVAGRNGHGTETVRSRNGNGTVTETFQK
jgi:hypothetical protein